jgi:hypothetical protein
MTEKPIYLSDQPVEVQIDSLHAFAMYVQQELDTNVRPNVTSVLGQLGQEGGVGGRSFGNDTRYSQGRRIGDYHTECVEKGQKLMRDLELGLQAIAYAAHSIANDFESADELNSMDLARVDGYFNPTDRRRSLAENGLPPAQPVDES